MQCVLINSFSLSINKKKIFLINLPITYRTIREVVIKLLPKWAWWIYLTIGYKAIRILLHGRNTRCTLYCMLRWVIFLTYMQGTYVYYLIQLWVLYVNFNYWNWSECLIIWKFAVEWLKFCYENMRLFKGMFTFYTESLLVCINYILTRLTIVFLIFWHSRQVAKMNTTFRIHHYIITQYN